MATALERGREAWERRGWADAHGSLAAAAEREPMGPDDLERLAVAAYLVGEEEESARAWAQASAGWARAGDPDRAARCAFWLVLGALLRGDVAQAAGWRARGTRLLDGGRLDCVARGYLLVPASMEQLAAGDPVAAGARAVEAATVALRHGDHDLLALARLCEAEAAIAAGDSDGGIGLLDEVMVAVTTGEVGPLAAGIGYCAVIEACLAVYDLRRAAEWTEAFRRWCDAQPDLVPFGGQCLVHRSQVLQAHGDWAAAASAASLACQRLSDPPHPTLGSALHQRAELHRLRGELDDAERGYREAARHGDEAAPGPALLRLAQGRVDAAVAAIRRCLVEAHEPLTRPAVLAAAVEILSAAGDRAGARAAAEELGRLAGDHGPPLLRALAGVARGAVLLADGDAAAALLALREACTTWRRSGMPYEEARARCLVARACTLLGDHDAAEVERELACATFERLGAGGDLAAMRHLGGAGGGTTTPPLTERERDVLRRVAAGGTNRQVAAELGISEHTVARHLQNIFAKLGLSSRSAATGYAYQRRLL